MAEQIVHPEVRLNKIKQNKNVVVKSKKLPKTLKTLKKMTNTRKVKLKTLMIL